LLLKKKRIIVNIPHRNGLYRNPLLIDDAAFIFHLLHSHSALCGALRLYRIVSLSSAAGTV
jgi:hypothetical protein